MDYAATKYIEKCNIPSDINEHLPTLCDYTKNCSSVVEFGMRSVVSTWAFLYGLQISNDSGTKSLISVDLNYDSRIEEVRMCAKALNIDFSFILGDDIKIEIPQTDLLFIDTWHIYGHLKRELLKHHSKVLKYIIMHDTTVDGELGETIRAGWDAVQQSRETGYPVEEINRGLWPAIEEFLSTHPEWKLEKRYTNNNGLTILSRI